MDPDTPSGSSTNKESLSHSSSFSALKERSNKRKQLLAKSLGAASTEDLSNLLGTSSERQNLRKSQVTPLASSQLIAAPQAIELPANQADAMAGQLIGPKFGLESIDSGSGKNLTVGEGSAKLSKRAGPDEDSDDDEKVVIDDYFKVLQEEEKEYTGSATFLKGTQSENPHNDYSQNFVDTGNRPQNYIRDPGLQERFEEYPKLKELIKLKDELVASTATAPMFLQADLKEFDIRDLGTRFDVIVIEPPLLEYQAKVGIVSGKDVWSWDMVEQLDIGSIADSRCFLWLWCGSGPEGTTRGRQCMRRWGFRRCEDICWVKRNEKNPQARPLLEPDAIFQRTKEHCLMGIKGTVRRSLDGDFIHANVDIDLIITEEPDPETSGVDPRWKPEEAFLIPEHFCLGRRRLHLFGRDDTLRPGWVTVGPELSTSNYDGKTYRNFFEKDSSFTTGCTERIESLRPKSPQPIDRAPKRQMDKRDGPPGMKPNRSIPSNLNQADKDKGPVRKGPPTGEQMLNRGQKRQRNSSSGGPSQSVGGGATGGQRGKNPGQGNRGPVNRRFPNGGARKLTHDRPRLSGGLAGRNLPSGNRGQLNSRSLVRRAANYRAPPARAPLTAGGHRGSQSSQQRPRGGGNQGQKPQALEAQQQRQRGGRRRVGQRGGQNRGHMPQGGDGLRNRVGGRSNMNERKGAGGQQRRFFGDKGKSDASRRDTGRSGRK